MQTPLTLAWLRRDLRLHDHAALSHASAQAQPVFVFDADILARFTNPADRRLSFIMRTLVNMHGQLREKGAGMLVLHGRAVELIPTLSKTLQAPVHTTADYEPDARARDAAVAKQCELNLHKDQVIFAPDEIMNQSGAPFKVFTPYSKTWRDNLSPTSAAPFPAPQQFAPFADVKARVHGFPTIDLDKGAAACLAQIGYQLVDDALWPVEDGHARLARFARIAANYKNTRDFMAVNGTSRLSPYLRFGLISVREAVALARETSPTWLSELIWREFYAQTLFHTPESAHTEWNPKYRGMAWQENADHLERWKQGNTGFPVVDAAMRQLLAEGWMHNRARMIVASFLTKDLQLSWREGEAHFAQFLMDYDMASNVGGWQWAASTGTDAQPYFRVFNPSLQSERFDAEGAYIRTYVPELSHMKGKAIHNPTPLERGAYPAPMVNHDDARKAAIAMFKRLP